MLRYNPIANKFALRLSSLIELLISESEPYKTFSKLSISDRFLFPSFGDVNVVLILLLLRLTKSPSYLELGLEVFGVSGRGLNHAKSRSLPVPSRIPLRFSATASYKASVCSKTYSSLSRVFS